MRKHVIRSMFLILLGALLLYTTFNALFGLWYLPIKVYAGPEKLGQIEEEIAPLRNWISNGTPIALTNPRQYGPVFMLILYPIVLLAPQYPLFEYVLYGIGIFCIICAFSITYRTLFPKDPHRIALAILLILWFNFSSVYYILGTKNVETWELFLLSVLLIALVRKFSWLAAIAVAAGTLIKLLTAI